MTRTHVVKSPTLTGTVHCTPNGEEPGVVTELDYNSLGCLSDRCPDTMIRGSIVWGLTDSSHVTPIYHTLTRADRQILSAFDVDAVIDVVVEYAAMHVYVPDMSEADAVEPITARESEQSGAQVLSFGGRRQRRIGA